MLTLLVYVSDSKIQTALSFYATPDTHCATYFTYTYLLTYLLTYLFDPFALNLIGRLLRRARYHDISVHGVRMA